MLDERMGEKGKENKIKWAGHGEDEGTGEPQPACDGSPQLIQKYEAPGDNVHLLSNNELRALLAGIPKPMSHGRKKRWPPKKRADMIGALSTAIYTAATQAQAADSPSAPVEHEHPAPAAPGQAEAPVGARAEVENPHRTVKVPLPINTAEPAQLQARLQDALRGEKNCDLMVQAIMAERSDHFTSKSKFEVRVKQRLQAANIKFGPAKVKKLMENGITFPQPRRAQQESQQEQQQEQQEPRRLELQLQPQTHQLRELKLPDCWELLRKELPERPRVVLRSLAGVERCKISMETGCLFFIETPRARRPADQVDQWTFNAGFKDEFRPDNPQFGLRVYAGLFTPHPAGTAKPFCAFQYIRRENADSGQVTADATMLFALKVEPAEPSIDEHYDSVSHVTYAVDRGSATVLQLEQLMRECPDIIQADALPLIVAALAHNPGDPLACLQSMTDDVVRLAGSGGGGSTESEVTSDRWSSMTGKIFVSYGKDYAQLLALASDEEEVSIGSAISMLPPVLGGTGAKAIRRQGQSDPTRRHEIVVDIGACETHSVVISAVSYFGGAAVSMVISETCVELTCAKEGFVVHTQTADLTARGCMIQSNETITLTIDPLGASKRLRLVQHRRDLLPESFVLDDEAAFNDAMAQGFRWVVTLLSTGDAVRVKTRVGPSLASLQQKSSGASRRGVQWSEAAAARFTAAMIGKTIQFMLARHNRVEFSAVEISRALYDNWRVYGDGGTRPQLTVNTGTTSLTSRVATVLEENSELFVARTGEGWIDKALDGEKHYSLAAATSPTSNNAPGPGDAEYHARRTGAAIPTAPVVAYPTSQQPIYADCGHPAASRLIPANLRSITDVTELQQILGKVNAELMTNIATQERGGRYSGGSNPSQTNVSILQSTILGNGRGVVKYMTC
eukprot:COSAG04_NODE_76_length_28498_cov_7.756294_14_plen_907_part_00